ncbi:enoyl-ACP reductase FabI [Krasilnikovia sp. M28-CT-15]|uniref:enoyl-ACP reductase FabI n=1 Tax=Krasilnikovia sp. M28-CT-15 TaxID=3373540 RepID=UPI00387787A3
MRLLDGKNVLVSGLLTESSIAFHVARAAQEHGATVVTTGYGRLSLVRRVANRLPRPVPVIELDVTDETQLAGLAGAVREHVAELHGVVHSIAYAPSAALGGGFLTTGWTDVAAALQVSTHSLVSLTGAVRDLLNPGAAVVGLDFDATVAWPGYDWMGVAKAGLESAARYLALYLGDAGIRTNLVAAGPLHTVAANSIGRARDNEDFGQRWSERAPLGWNTKDPEPVARTCVALLSDLMPATTGQIVHVDGGAHAVGHP